MKEIKESVPLPENKKQGDQMKILLIGNGFDLEHHLPTTYSNFLNFCTMVQPIFDESVPSYENYESWLQSKKINAYIKKGLLAAFKRKSSRQSSELPKGDLIQELYDCLEDNIWIRHFRSCQSITGKNWIDFESEISRVIQVLDAARLILLDGQPIAKLKREKLLLFSSFCENINASIYEISSIERLTSRLTKDLDRLTRALEIYLARFVNRIPIESKSPDIENLKPDCVLSFNYSNTYQRIYDPNHKIKYDYIHGKADTSSNVETCSLVLGIDEYLDDERKDLDLQFLAFKKYYQRIYKGTDSTYLDWVREIREGNAQYERDVESARQNELHPLQNRMAQQMRSLCLQTRISSPSRHTLYIFGHSLDVTDKDILRALICNDHVKTVIYYHRTSESDKRTLGQLIHNLVKIIGQEELIRRTGGSKRSIQFVPQTIRSTENTPAVPCGELAAVP